MKIHPYRAFGLIFSVNHHDVGDTFQVKVTAAARCTTYQIQGRFQVIDLNTDHRVADHAAVTFACSRTEPPGLYRYTCVEPSVIYCYDPMLNRGNYQEFSPLEIPTGQTRTLSMGTKYFLMAGILKVGNQQLVGPAKVHITSAATTCVSQQHCYGLQLI